MSNQNRRELLEAFGRAMPDLQDANDTFDEVASELFGINRTDMRVMSVVVRGGPISASELADAAGLSRSAMTTSIDRLVAAGHVRRTPDADDRRAIRIEATPQVLKVCDAVWGPLAAEGATMLARHPDAVLAAALEILHDARALQEKHTERVRAMVRKRRR